MQPFLSMPSPCALCGCLTRASLCTDCHQRFWPTCTERCIRCAIPMPHPSALNECGSCIKDPPPFDATIAAADYSPPIDQMVLALKFGGKLALAPLFADRIHESFERHPHELPQLLTTVPLAPGRLAERGFNQALEIARPLARKLKIPLNFKLVVRTRETAAQSLLPHDERHKNIRYAFDVPSAEALRLKGLHVGIVDDVMTTGETLNELAALLKRKGASRITNFVFARTLK